MTHPKTLRSVALISFLFVGGSMGLSVRSGSKEEDSSKTSISPSGDDCSSPKEDPHCLLVNSNASSSSGAAVDVGEQGEERRPRPTLNVIPLPLLSAPRVSVEEFRAKHLSPPGGRALPLHIKNLRGVDPSDWTRSRLRELCGDAPLMEDEECEYDDEDDAGDEDCHSVKLRKRKKAEMEWGGLESANLEEWDMKTWGDLMDRQDTQEGRGLYLHDASIVNMCPEALDELPGMPKYFQRDYTLFEDFQKNMDIGKDVDLNDENFWDIFANYVHFPSIFIGKGGSSGSRLHSDSGLTRAFMLHLSGRKVWRLAAPEDHSRLYPTDPSAMIGTTESGVYKVDLFDPDFEAYPLLDGLTVYEVVAEPGDVVFFPEGWPHQVRNLDDTIAISVNFVDNGNLDAVAEFNRIDDGEDDYIARFAASFLAPLDDPPFVESDEGTDFTSFRTFVKNQVIRSVESVPAAAWQLVEEIDSSMLSSGDIISEHRDRYGRTPLHSAAEYNFAPVVRHLLHNVGIDPNIMDDCGRTPLTMTKNNRANDTISSLLKRHGGVRKITDDCKKTLKKKLKQARLRRSTDEVSEAKKQAELREKITVPKMINLFKLMKESEQAEFLEKVTTLSSVTGRG